MAGTLGVRLSKGEANTPDKQTILQKIRGDRFSHGVAPQQKAGIKPAAVS